MDIVSESEQISKWLHSKIDRIAVASDERTRVAAGCFDIVLEHQISITILLNNKLYGSAFALARSVFEAYVRGIWIKNCATEEQVKDFLNEKFNFKFYQLIDDIEKLDGYSVGVISSAKKAGWGILNGFTHTGAGQIFRRNTENYIESNYSEEDINKVAGFVNTTSLLAGVEITFLSKTDASSLQKEFLEKMKEYASYP